MKPARRICIGAAALASLAWIVADPCATYGVFRFAPPDSSDVTLAGLQFSHLVLFGAAWLVTGWFGYALSWRWFREVSAPFVLKAASSFAIGYLACLPILRLLSLAASGPPLYLVALLLLSGAGLLLLAPAFREARAPVRAAPATLLLASGLALAFLLFLVIQVFQGDFVWVGHGRLQYAFFLHRLREQTPGAPFPILTLHYDELLYAHLLTSPAALSFDAILPMWMTLALNKVSAASLLFCVFRRLDVSVLSASLGTAFLTFGTFSLNPLKYLLLFDSSNPLGYAVHSGRVVAIPLALLCLAEFLGKPGERGRTIGGITLLLMGAGLSATSVSNLAGLGALWAAGTLLSAGGAGGWASDPRTLRALAAAAFAVPALSYALIPHAGAPGFLFAPYFAALAAFLAPHAAAALRAPRESLLPRLKPALLFAAGAGAGLLLLGNIWADNPVSRQLLGLARSLGALADLGVEYPQGFERIEPVPTRLFVDARETHAFSEYSRSAVHFMGYYGLLFAGVFWAFRLLRPAPEPGPARLHGLLLAILAAGLPLCFFFMDFVRSLNRQWVKSRFLEVPVYGILFLVLVAADRLGTERQRRAARIGCLAFVVLPILATGRLRQWWENYGMLAGLLP